MSSNIFSETFKKYDSGTNPSLASCKEYFIEVHESENFRSIWYHIGTFEFQKKKKLPRIEWGPSLKLDSGVTPHVTMNNFKCVIEVHKSEFLDNLFYHVGVVESPKKVAWGSRTKYESGLFPTVSLNDNNVVVEMHQTKEGSLVYAFGELDISNRVIQFGAWIKLIERGTTPRIALGINAVVEVHQENGNQLCYTLGVLQASSKTIQWGNFNLFDRGSNPCITVGGQDYLNIIITHQMKDSLFCNVGRISLANMNVKWNGITLYAKGRLPQVANNCKNFVLSVHKSPDNSDLNYDLAYSLPCIVESVQGVGVSSDPNKNYRSSMEDEHIVIDQFNSYDSLYVGVYDGHGGRQAVELVRDHLHNFVLKAIEKYGLPDQHNEVNKMWNEAFAETDKLVIQYSALEEREDKSGSTAAVALIWSINGERYLETANIGDARTVLIRGGKAVRLSYDHKANDPAEKQRMEAGGAVVLMDKVCAILSVSRAFGDSEFKKWVICEPYTMSTKLTVEDTHLIVACDGLWDVVDDQEVADFIMNDKNKNQPQKLSDKLVQLALKKGTKDNVSIIVVRITK